MTKPDLPPHLREETPPNFCCDQCGRKDWSPGLGDWRCAMTQPDGSRCQGVMRLRAAEPDLPPLPTNTQHALRRIQLCELGGPAAQLVLEHYARAYALLERQAERERCAQVLLRISNAPDMQAYAAAIRDQK